MTKLSDVFNELVTITQATLPTYNHLPDGLDVEKNTDLELNYGFSVNCGPATAGATQFGCQFQLFEREYQIAITNIYAKRTDPVSRDTYELNLMEDLYKVVKAILVEPSLGGLVSGVDYNGDIGPQYLDGDTQEFLYTDVTFNVIYQENLN